MIAEIYKLEKPGEPKLGAHTFSCPHCNAVAVTEMFTSLRAILERGML